MLSYNQKCFSKAKNSSKLLSCFLILFCNLSSVAEQKENSPEVFKNEIIPLLDKYCYRCHDDKKQKGDMRLDIYKDASQILPNRKHWLLVLEQLETREMPTKKPLPTEEEYLKLTHFVEKAANDIDWEKIKQPGHVTIPLLTKEEYYNTLEELLGLNLRAHSTFSEDSEGVSGFTNDRDGLFVSTSKLEKYILTAESAIDSVLAVNKGPQLWKLESEKMFMTETRETPKKVKDDFFGYILNRGQMSLYDSIDVPADGLYEVSVRVSAPSGIAATDLRVDNKLKAHFEATSKLEIKSELIYLSKGSRQFTWNIGASNKVKDFESKKKEIDPDLLKKAAEDSRKKLLQIPDSMVQDIKKAKYSTNKLNKVIRQLQLSVEKLKAVGTDGKEKFIAKTLKEANQAKKSLKTELSTINKKTKKKADKEFNKVNAAQIAENEKVFKAFNKRKVIKSGPVAIDWMILKGPINPPESKVLSLNPTGSSKEAAAQKIIRDFLPRAFRKPVTESDIKKYLSLYKNASSQGESFESSIKQTLTAVLVSPKFLFRDELQKTDKVYELNDYQLASRLSYFLWMSMPDQELFELAEKGDLKKKEVLKAQIDRMLKDKRSRRFTKAFAGEWLGFKSLGYSVMPDEKKFPQYSPELNKASKLETVMLLENLFQNGGSLLNLIDSNYTYLNDQLAKHYGMQNIDGEEMRRVELINRYRGGLLGMSSILTSTSNPSRTSPVNRGLWVFEKLLGQHMGAPPADVPPLPENAGHQKGKTLRQVFEEHRDNPACSTCHNKIDPLGFGLENFDAIGRYRKSENGKEIDASGKMPDGSSFVGIVELKEYILKKKKKEFLRNISERLLSFALGRELQYFDEPAIKKIYEATQKDKYSASTLLSEVIFSYPFLSQSNNTEILGD
ncbi:MAG: DUF1592 domain-containing protein, partial [Lentisphaeraceae bacterium]|nr:DUF1592 domain-containing protein [Lentisphaeraceae bacterium]